MPCPKSADSVAKSKIERDRKFCEIKAPQRRYDGPWSFLFEAMWSLTPPLARHISGPRKFCSSPKKDFFNTIGTNGRAGAA
jgi:hypothetical protein